MLRLVKALLCFAAAAGLGFVPAPGQTPTPTPSTAKPATPPADSGITLKTNARIVVVDVVVTDKSQNPIHNLKVSDFTLLEGSAPQTINHFEEHVYLKTSPAAAPPALHLPTDVFTNYSPVPVSGAVNVVLLDTLNTPMADQAYVRQQLLKYLEQAQPGTRTAVFGLTTHLVMLQSFTTDPAVLKAVIAHMNAKGSPLLDDQVGGGGVQGNATDAVEDMADSLGTDSGTMAEMIANMREFDAIQQSFQLQLRAKYTLDAMSQLARYLAGIPGRKNLIWFSGSFPIDILPDTTGTFPNAFAAVASSEDEFRDTVGLLARSQVAVYPVAAGGLATSPVFSAATNRNYGGPKGVGRMNQDNQKFFTDTADAQSTMRQMADATGGHAFVNTNGLTQAVASAIDDGSNYYTLTYTPTNGAADGKFRKIKVELAQRGLNLAYRQGYYADDPAKTPYADLSVATKGGPTPQTALHIAMMRGAPIPTQILMKVGVVPITPADKPEAAPAAGNLPTARLKGPYRRYAVNTMVDPKDITFLRTPDGRVHADFDFIIFVFDPDGNLLNAKEDPIHVIATLDEIKKGVSQGIFFHQEVSAPAKGEYFLRIAIHDLNRDHFGAVEVATSAVKMVVAQAAPPAAAPATAPAPQLPPK